MRSAVIGQRDDLAVEDQFARRNRAGDGHGFGNGNRDVAERNDEMPRPILGIDDRSGMQLIKAIELRLEQRAGGVAGSQGGDQRMLLRTDHLRRAQLLRASRAAAAAARRVRNSGGVG